MLKGIVQALILLIWMQSMKLDLEQNQYIQSRHCVWSYEKRFADAEMKVIELASCAPSACNRQPVKVFVTTDPERVKAVSMLIPGKVKPLSLQSDLDIPRTITRCLRQSDVL